MTRLPDGREVDPVNGCEDCGRPVSYAATHPEACVSVGVSVNPSRCMRVGDETRCYTIDCNSHRVDWREVARILAVERYAWAADAWEAAATLAASGFPSEQLAITGRANAAELRKKATP